MSPPDPEVHDRRPAEPPTPGCPVVGIGASAGGLAAFEAFFSGMPANAEPDMAFVIVQHLAPDHESVLTALIRRYTRMQVFEVEDGMTVRPNCAYIIPPNRDMALLNGRLALLEPAAPRGHRMPIDFFFRSLAIDQRERAIGIVLTGTGSDGALGVRAIKGAGGMVMVQDPDGLEFDGMPRSALATGLVDYRLPPAQMPSQLIAYVTLALPATAGAAPVPMGAAEHARNRIFVLLRAQTGHDFSGYKPSTVHRRIERRMAVQQISTLDEYVRFAQETPAEVTALFRDLLIGVTSFFRDPTAFDAVERLALVPLLTDASSDRLLRVWVPGCSTGEEAYSLAMLLAEHQDAPAGTRSAQMFATDIDREALEIARAGRYPASVAADLSPERLARFFTAAPDGSTCHVQRRIRETLIFSEHDLTRDPPFSRIDLISCRNLLIYMGGALQRRVMSLFHYALNPGGVLFLGTSETVGECGDLFEALDRKAKVYRRLPTPPGVHPSALGRFRSHGAAHHTPTATAPAPETAPPPQSLRALTEQALLTQAVPAAALVTGRGDVLYLHGRTGHFLEPAPGESRANNILQMAREGLRHALVTALREAAYGPEAVHRPNLRVKTNGDYSRVTVVVQRVVAGPAGPGTAPTFLVVFEQHAGTAPGSEASSDGAAPDAGDDVDARISELQRELRAKDEYLRATNEELETSNEELRSSNEEMQAVNEELQSTNEELETSKEELQSLNEELATVNAELHARVSELSRTNSDMNNLLSGTGVATIFVDHGLRVLRFTPTAQEVINLIAEDVGRPVGHIASNLLGYDTLVSDVRTVLDTLVPKEVEVQSATGTWYLMRIQPYRTLENLIEGAVVTFMDISRAKELEATLREARRGPAPEGTTP